jgi:predicted ABC-type ATPase
MQKQIHIIAGTNGAGKTTKADLLLPKGFLQTNEFVNADNIAKGLSPYNFDSKAVNLQAGRQMLKRIDQLIKEQKSFAFETTLSGVGYVNLVKKCQDLGYLVNLIYLYLDSPELNIARVKIRVAKGGHDIEENDIRRRYSSGIYNLLNIYLKIIDSATIFDASKIELHSEEDKIAEKFPDGIKIFKAEIWNNLLTVSKKNESTKQRN